MKIPVEVLNVSAACDVETSRYALGNLAIEAEPDGSLVAVATDGRCLIAASWVDEGPALEKPLLVPFGQANVLLDAMRKLPVRRKPHDVTLVGRTLADRETGGRLVATMPCVGYDLVIDAAAGEGRFPRYREVLKPLKRRDGAPTAAIDVCVDLRILKKCVDAMLAIASKLSNGDPDKPAAVLTVHAPVDSQDGGRITLSATGDKTRSCAVLMGISRGSGPFEGPMWVPAPESRKPIPNPQSPIPNPDAKG